MRVIGLSTGDQTRVYFTSRSGAIRQRRVLSTATAGRIERLFETSQLSVAYAYFGVNDSLWDIGAVSVNDKAEQEGYAVDSIIKIEGEEFLITLDHNSEYVLCPVGDSEKNNPDFNDEDSLQESVFKYLDSLRESAVVNMFGAAPYVASKFDLEKEESQDLLVKWMDSFSERHSEED
jgi:hypothetical protein